MSFDGWFKLTSAAACGLTLAVIGLTVEPAAAHEQYSGCATCHGEFTGPMSPQGTVFPNDDKHYMHRNSGEMNTECDLCHTSGPDFSNPFIGSSDGTDMNPGSGCTGCHGRDYGGILGDSGVGLRAHHAINDVTTCAVCHDSDPAPLGEDILPTYYGTFDSNVFESCNETGSENWSIGDDIGLDNDGDNLYDGDDPDCGGMLPCPGDTNESGTVDTVDLLGLLGAWGSSDPTYDIAPPPDGDGDVNVVDLLLLLGSWGDCP